jgi:hypothetical protein
VKVTKNFTIPKQERFKPPIKEETVVVEQNGTSKIIKVTNEEGEDEDEEE